jgi:very-short-patch-repair endonuclease
LTKELRNKSTLSEVLLWRYLKGKQVRGHDFHRQKPIGNYIVDFFCNDLMMVIEIDGASHGDKIKEDAKRQRELESLNIKVLRFKDSDVKNNMGGVLDAVYKWVDDFTNRV